MKTGRLFKNIAAIGISAMLVASFSACGDLAETDNNTDNAVSEAVSQQNSSVTHTAAVTYTEDTTVSGDSFNSTGTDENAILIEDGSVSLENITVTRESDDSTGGDNASFYGVGAAILATGGNTTIKNANITTDAKGGAGVFSYGDAVINISDSVISTASDTSGGIHVAGGGTLYATNVTATTQGGSSAAIRSDRGGGLLVVDGGTYTSNGSGSPAVYCTANIVIENAKLESTNSEAICIEGLNGLYLFDTDLVGNMPEDSQNDCTWNVILYQSMSGDSQEGNSTFQMQGGSLTAKNGGMFYTTNTESTFILNGVDIIYSDSNDFFLKCTGNSNARGWGESGSNGADCNFTAINQVMEGNIIWDSISELDFYMTDGSTLTGAFVKDESNAGNGGSGYANLYISEDSTWTVTADCTLTNLYNAGLIVGADGLTVTIKGSDGTVYVSGNGAYTITVDSYKTAADLSGAAAITSYDEAQVNNGSQDSGMGGAPSDMGEAPGNGQTPPEMPGGASGSFDGPGRADSSSNSRQKPSEKPGGSKGS